MDIYPVRLAAAHAIAARRIGAGNLSDGVRLALEACKKAPELLQEKSPVKTGLLVT